MPGANFETREWDVVSGRVPSSGESHVVWAESHLRLVDNPRAMVAALPVAAFSVVGMVNVFPDKVFEGWTDRAKAAAHVTFSDGMDGRAQLLDCL